MTPFFCCTNTPPQFASTCRQKSHNIQVMEANKPSRTPFVQVLNGFASRVLRACRALGFGFELVVGVAAGVQVDDYACRQAFLRAGNCRTQGLAGNSRLSYTHGRRNAEYIFEAVAIHPMVQYLNCMRHQSPLRYIALQLSLPHR